MDSRDAPKRKLKLGEILVRNGWVTWENLEKALSLQKELEHKQSDSAPDIMMMSYPTQMLSIGEILVRNGWLNWVQLDLALDFQKQSGELIGKILVDRKFITWKEFYRAMAIQLDMVFIDFDKIRVDPEAVKLVPQDFAEHYNIIPVVRKEQELLIAVSNPSSVDAESELKSLIPDFKVHAGLSSPDDITKAIRQYYG